MNRRDEVRDIDRKLAAYDTEEWCVGIDEMERLYTRKIWLLREIETGEYGGGAERVRSLFKILVTWDRYLQNETGSCQSTADNFFIDFVHKAEPTVPYNHVKELFEEACR